MLTKPKALSSPDTISFLPLVVGLMKEHWDSVRMGQKMRRHFPSALTSLSEALVIITGLHVLF